MYKFDRLLVIRNKQEVSLSEAKRRACVLFALPGKSFVSILGRPPSRHPLTSNTSWITTFRYQSLTEASDSETASGELCHQKRSKSEDSTEWGDSSQNKVFGAVKRGSRDLNTDSSSWHHIYGGLQGSDGIYSNGSKSVTRRKTEFGNLSSEASVFTAELQAILAAAVKMTRDLIIYSIVIYCNSVSCK